MVWMIRIVGGCLICGLTACDAPSYPSVADPPVTSDDLTSALSLDPATGIPYAITFQQPIAGFGTADYGFGFGQVNDYFCLNTNAQQQCTSYGYHLGRDTEVAETPVGTRVDAPADGIVRITTDQRFGGFGSDAVANPHYAGCAIVVEHLLKNQQAVTTLLGHVQCEAVSAYDPNKQVGNPPVGSLVQRGQYVAHVAHYWHGLDQSTDWHHLHWGMRKGHFSRAANPADYVEGYAPRSEFTVDPSTDALVHPEWVDPFIMLAANGDPVTQADTNVRAHPSGTLLQDPQGDYWLVTQPGEIARVPNNVLVMDRYDTNGAIRVSDQEIGCARQGSDVSAFGHVTLYVRPGTNIVVMAYDQFWERHDVVRWEALLSWGYDDSDLLDQTSSSFYESSYQDRGLRLMRPGTLVKADDASEVAIVTTQQTRLPIASADVFEQAGFQWERIVSLPASVLDAVAGPRESSVFTLDDLQTCAASNACPGGAATCGGGAPPPSSDSGESGGGERSAPASTSTSAGVASQALHLVYRSSVSGPIILQGWWQNTDGSNRAWDTIPCPDADDQDDQLDCDLPVPSGAPQFEFQLTLPGPAYWGDESCSGGGCGAPLGELHLKKDGASVPIAFVPNPSGPPFYNGRVAPVP